MCLRDLDVIFLVTKRVKRVGPLYGGNITPYGLPHILAWVFRLEKFFATFFADHPIFTQNLRLPTFQDVRNLIMINIRSLTNTYVDFVAVNVISFKVHSGEIFGLLGPNDAWKSYVNPLVIVR